MSVEMISVIVISYNSADTILQTLESIKKQTYQNLELIISDDCSSDNTIELAESWVENNKNRFGSIQVLKNNLNIGIPGNCNRGIKAVSSNLFKLIAADDLLYPDAISTYKRYYKENRICQAKVVCFGDLDHNLATIYFCNKSQYYIKKRNIYKLLLKRNIIVAPAVGLLSKKTIQNYGGFDEQFPGFEDYPMWIKLAKNGFDFFQIDKVLVKYRLKSKRPRTAITLVEKSYFEYFQKTTGALLIKEHMYLTFFIIFLKQWHVKLGIKYGISSIQYSLSKIFLLDDFIRDRFLHLRLNWFIYNNIKE